MCRRIALRILISTDLSAGLQTPVLTVDKLKLREGDDVTAVCTAEGEISSLAFFFSDGFEELYMESTESRRVEKQLALTKGSVNIFCYYSINLRSTIERSNDSNVISLDIQGMSIHFHTILYNKCICSSRKCKHVHIPFQFRAGDQSQYHSQPINICH